jgi:hypothetical protein
MAYFEGAQIVNRKNRSSKLPTFLRCIPVAFESLPLRTGA